MEDNPCENEKAAAQAERRSVLLEIIDQYQCRSTSAKATNAIAVETRRATCVARYLAAKKDNPSLSQEIFCQAEGITRKTLSNYRRLANGLDSRRKSIKPLKKPKTIHLKQYLNPESLWELVKIRACHPHMLVSQVVDDWREKIKKLGLPSASDRSLRRFVDFAFERELFVRLVNLKEHADSFNIRPPYNRDHETLVAAADEGTTVFQCQGENGRTDAFHFAVMVHHASRCVLSYVTKVGAINTADTLQLGLDAFLRGPKGFDRPSQPFKTLLTDKGGPFACDACCTGYKELDVTYRPLVANSHWLNGVAECLIKNIKGRLKRYERIIDEEKRGKCEYVFIRYTFEEFQAFFEEEIRSYNHEHIHSAIGCTPFARFLELQKQFAVKDDFPDFVKETLVLREQRVATKKGLQMHNRLWEFPGLRSYIGQSIEVRMGLDSDARMHAYHGGYKLGELEEVTNDPKQRGGIRSDNKDRNALMTRIADDARKAGESELAVEEQAALARARGAQAGETPSRKGYIDLKTPTRVKSVFARQLNVAYPKDVESDKLAVSREDPIPKKPSCARVKFRADVWCEPRHASRA